MFNNLSCHLMLYVIFTINRLYPRENDQNRPTQSIGTPTRNRKTPHFIDSKITGPCFTKIQLREKCFIPFSTVYNNLKKFKDNSWKSKCLAYGWGSNQPQLSRWLQFGALVEASDSTELAGTAIQRQKRSTDYVNSHRFTVQCEESLVNSITINQHRIFQPRLTAKSFWHQ